MHQTLGSYFLTRPNVENFCDALCTATSLIDPAKWIHIPIDGHNTCWAVFNVIHGEWERANFLILLILEAVDCMHDALQDGAKAPSIWLLAKVLSTMYKVLKHFPVSVFDNISYYTSYKTEDWTETARQLWPDMVEYIKFVMTVTPMNRPKDDRVSRI